MRRENPAAVILDLPEADVEGGGCRLYPPEGAALFNIRHRGSDLRRSTCWTALFHVMPSGAMLNDGLAQYLKSVGWDKVLVLTSSAPADLAQSELFQASARKFGLRISDVRQFVPGNDPRQRDQNNVRLLTGGADYDAVFVADETCDFARTPPYRTFSPRPVVGAAGFEPPGLASTLGVPRRAPAQPPLLQIRRPHHDRGRLGRLDSGQVNRRGAGAGRQFRRPVGASTVEARSHPRTLQRLSRLVSPLGPPAAPEHPARHPREVVIALAPVEGALHQFNNLDTLGLDEPEFICP